MHQELSSGFEDGDSEDISTQHSRSEIKAAGDMPTQDFRLQENAEYVQKDSLNPPRLLRKPSTGTTVFNSLESNIQLLKNEAQTLNECIECLSKPLSFDNLPNACQIQVPVPKNGPVRRLDLLGKVKLSCSEKGAKNCILLSLLKDPLLKNVPNEDGNDDVSSHVVNGTMENVKKVVVVWENEIEKRNQVEARYLEQIYDLQIFKASLEEQLKAKVNEIESLRKSESELKLIAEVYGSQGQPENNVIKQAIDKKIFFENRVKELENELNLAKSDYEARFQILQRELKIQVQERQKNDYKKIFLEDKVALLIEENKMLNQQSKGGETLGIITNPSNESKSEPNLQLLLEDKEKTNEDSSLTIVDVPNTEKSTVQHCMNCDNLLVLKSKLESNILDSAESKSALEQKVTSLMKEKMELADHLCEAGRMNEDIKNQLQIQTKKSDEVLSEKIAEAKEEFDVLQVKCTNQTNKIIKLESEAKNSNFAVDEIRKRCELLDNMCTKQHDLIVELRSQISEIGSSQKSLSHEQATNMQKLLDLQIKVANENQNKKYLDECDFEVHKSKFRNRKVLDDEDACIIRDKISSLENYNSTLSIKLQSYKQRIKLLEQKLVSQTQKLKVFQEKKKFCRDSKNLKYNLDTMKLEQSMSLLKMKNDFSANASAELEKRLHGISERAREDSKRLVALEAQNIDLASSLKEKNLLLKIKESELEKFKSDYGNLRFRYNELKSMKSGQGINRSNDIDSTSYLLAKTIYDRLDGLSITNGTQKFFSEDTQSQQNTSITDYLELKHLRSENSRFASNSAIFSPERKTRVNELIQQSHMRALIKLSNDKPDITPSIGSPLLASSPLKSSFSDPKS